MNPHNIKTIRDALSVARGVSKELMCEALAALAELERAAEEPVGWQWLNTCHYRRYLPDAAEQPEWRPLYTTPPPAQPAPGMFTAEEMESAKRAAYQAGAEKMCAEIVRTCKERTK